MKTCLICGKLYKPMEEGLLFDVCSESCLKTGMVRQLKRTNVDPALIYAFEKTGFMLTDANKSQMSKSQLKEWDAALTEYEKKK